MKTKIILTAAVVGGLAFAATVAPAASPSAAATGKRPNIVIILGDDLGFSDLGCFGGEIKTPRLDSLAKAGVRCTQFYTHASCSPTRSMLLSGTDTHRNGLGNMDEWTAPNQMGKPGYEGYLHTRVATLPQLLKDSGYHTYMVGKWHMGKKPDLIPVARGFERDFALLDGAGSYWDMLNFTASNPKSTYTEDGRYLKKLPKDYYATKTYTDKMIGYIEANRRDGKPFFAYVSHQAPHDPYHLPRDWRNRHVGEYDKGWDAVRRERLKRQVELGVTPAGTELAERMWFVPDPIVLAPAPRAVLGKKMELYAGMVENMDFHIGRLIDYLKKIGEYDNTIFIVFGDNGAEVRLRGRLHSGPHRRRVERGAQSLRDWRRDAGGGPGVCARAGAHARCAGRRRVWHARGGRQGQGLDRRGLLPARRRGPGDPGEGGGNPAAAQVVCDGG